MQLSVVHGGPSSRFSQVFRWLQPLTDDHFRDDKKGGAILMEGALSSRWEPHFIGKMGPGGQTKGASKF